MARCWPTLIARHGADCWLVNTGWTGGAYGTGQRMSIEHTRALLARRAGRHVASDARYVQDPFFGLMFPQDMSRHPNEVLDPRQSPGRTRIAYDRPAKDLVSSLRDQLQEVRDVPGRRKIAGVEWVKAAAIRAAA